MNDPSASLFKGFEAPEENWSKLPHALIEALPLFTSMAELKVVMYVLRHTWGYREYETSKAITLDEFAHGRKRKDGTRIDTGTGLAKSNIVRGLTDAAKHGFLTVDKDDKDRGRKRRSFQIRMYRIETSEVSNRNIRGIETVHPSEKETFDEKPVKETSLTPSASPAQSKPEIPIPSPSQTVAPSPRQPSVKLPPPRAKAVAPSSGKTERGKSPRALPGHDPLWNAIADTFFQGARKGNQRLARILFGKADHGLFGLIAYEVEHQNCTADRLDYHAIAAWIPKFHASLPKDNSGKTIELRDPAKFIERWIGWRETTNRIECPPQLSYDPNCPHRFDAQPCDQGTIYKLDDKGNPYREECECMTRIRAQRKGIEI